MATQYDPIAKDESLNTTELTPRNIADVLAEGLDDIVTALGGGSLEDLNDVTITTPSNGQTLKYNSTTQKWENANDAGGHTIYDADEQAMTQRAGLGFTDAHVSDNSGDDRTDISLIEGISKTDWDNLDPTDPSNNGLYEIEMPNNTPILTASQVGYGTGTVADALDKLDIYKTYNLTDSMYYGVTSHSGLWYIFYIPLFPIESGDVVSLSLSDVSIYIGGSIYSVSDLNLADTEIRIGDMGIRIDLKFTSAHLIDTFGVLRVNSNGGTMTVSKQ